MGDRDPKTPGIIIAAQNTHSQEVGIGSGAGSGSQARRCWVQGSTAAFHPLSHPPALKEDEHTCVPNRCFTAQIVVWMYLHIFEIHNDSIPHSITIEQFSGPRVMAQ